MRDKERKRRIKGVVRKGVGKKSKWEEYVLCEREIQRKSKRERNNRSEQPKKRKFVDIKEN